MINKVSLLATALTASVAISGCSSISKATHSSSSASLNAQAAQIVTRPTEYAYKTLGTATGEASQTSFLIWTIEGDKTSASVKGAFGSSDLENLAAFRAVKSLGGDAFFKLSTEVEEIGPWPFFSKEVIRVTGKVLKIEDLGTIAAERADKMSVTEDEEESEGGWFD